MSNNKSAIYLAQRSVSLFLKKWLEKKENFECRSFYGETFTLALLKRGDFLENGERDKLLSVYEKKNKENSQFHWEFNNYALLDYLSFSGDTFVYKFLKPLRFKGTLCTNWTLLRSSSRLKAGQDCELAIREAKEKIEKFQQPSGLILDDPGVKSFQYHCFSMAMIAEIYELTGDDFFYESFLGGTHFIRRFILSNGETLYVGRGQNQSFGYATLIYILTLAYKYTGDKTTLGDIDLILKFFLKFQRADGSFPLMLNDIERSIPAVVDVQEPEFVGWYPYNNYFDYLPFMGFFLNKAYGVLSKVDHDYAIEYAERRSYRDKDFIKIVNPSYEAVISRTGGYWTNDLPIPYVVAGGKNITPCYGGEQFQKSLYNVLGIPLPYSFYLKKSIRWKSVSFFIGNVLWVVSPLGVMRREYVFEREAVRVMSNVFSVFKFKHVYLFLDSKIAVANVAGMKSDGFEYSASGKLRKYLDSRKKSALVLKVSV